MKVTVEVTGAKELTAAFDYVQDGVADLRKGKAWLRVRQEFYKIQKEHFAAEGNGKTGKFAALSPAYKKVKQAKYGNAPILQASKRLYKSLTSGGGEAIIEEGPQEMVLGTSVPYAGYHQSGTGKMPARPPIDLTDEHEKRLTEPVNLYLRQLASNARLRSLR